MLRPGVTQEWVDEGELSRERKKKSEMAEALRCVSRGHIWRSCSSSSSHENLYAMEMSPGADMVQRIVVERGEEATTSPVGLSYPKVKRRLERRWTQRRTTVLQRRIYRSRKKGCRCKVTDSRAMGLAAPWYCRGGTSVELSIPCYNGGRALVVKGAEEVENAKANSKYQDRVEGQRPRNFIRPVSMDFSSREPKARDFKLMQECSTKEQSRKYAELYLFYSEE
ncbi:hypothetical protein GW17_00027731 [Ensete ventricosum]|nr:hypothetical protein GW17_00027731 [Ensete ventricosum]